MRALFLVLGVWLSAACWVVAQPTVADTLSSRDRGQYLSQLETFMTAGKQQAVEDAYRDFAKNLQSGLFTEAETALIQAQTDEMRRRRLGASPYFKEYLKAVIQLKSLDPSGVKFSQWHPVAEKLLRDEANFKPNNYLDFIEFSASFFEYGALRYSPASVSWFVYNRDVEWAYDGQPLIKIAKTDLFATRKQDSIFIEQTSGVFFPNTGLWKGQGGKVDWRGTDLGRGVFVDLLAYDIDTKSSLYDAPNAILHFPLYFGNRLVEGSFSHKLTSDTSRSTYPRFLSKEGGLTLNDVGEGIRLSGGLRIEGSTVYTTGTRDIPSRLTMYGRNPKPFLRAEGRIVAVRDQNRIVGDGLDVSVYVGQDSIYHPSANLRLDLKTREIQLTRGQGGADRNNFYHSLHHINIDADNVNVYPDMDSIVIGKPARGFAIKQDVAFESLNYFDEIEYRRIQNIATANPIAIMKATADRENTRQLPAQLLATRINSKFTVDNIRTLLYDLVSKGFINYDGETQMIEIKDKVIQYVESDQNNRDYDLLRIMSQSDSINARMSMTSGYSLISGVRNIEFSPKHRVAARSLGGQFLLKGDRNLDFDGRVFAGYTRFEGNDFHFDYQPFVIRMDSVRYFDLFEPTDSLINAKNVRHAVSISSRIEHLTGVLLIDAPGNKSGRDSIALFPSLQSKEYSFVYYDYKGTQNGAYKRDSFYFRLIPFSFNRLSTYESSDIRFKGTLFSADIFPRFDETVLLRSEDKSLGFVTRTPKNGYPAYGGKGTYAGELDLSNKGLLGKGGLKYLGASINSEDFIFMPKQTLASAERFDLEEVRTQPQVPQVRGEDVKIDWRPYQDSMYIRSEKAAFNLYRAGEHTFDGTLILTPGGLKGDGKLSWPLAVMQSELFNFGAFAADADTMSIKINSLEGNDRIALETQNMHGIADFEKGKGDFKANDESLDIRLPDNQYETVMGGFVWNMKGELIKLYTADGKPGVFTSTHPDQHKLTFQGDSATFNLRTSMLEVEGVPYVVSADAYIYPDSGRVEIGQAAVMTKLENARIVADTISKYHVINRATVNVAGRRNYTASGFYEYNVAGREQEIELQNIVGQPVGKGAIGEKATVTRASGEISANDTFYIDHKTRFFGEITFSAESPTLLFDGYARLDADKLPSPYWFSVTSPGDKNNLFIAYNTPLSQDREPLETGFYLSKESAQVYPRIMMPLRFRKDRAILPVKGTFTYDETRDEFIFGDSSKLVSKELFGNQLVFRNRDGSLEGEGRFNLGSGLKYCSFEATGQIHGAFPPPAPEEEEQKPEDNIILNEDIMMADDSLSTASQPSAQPDQPLAQAPPLPPVTVDWMAGLKFNLPGNLLDIVVTDIKSATFQSRLITYLTDLDFYRRSFTEFFPAGKDRQDAIDGLTLGVLDLPKRVTGAYAFLFSRLKMRWDRDYQSFVSTEKQNGIISINGEPIGKMLECYVELKMPTDEDDRLYVYLKSPSELFYFFGYQKGILSVTSNNPSFMDAANALKEKDRVIKMPDGETYEIQVVEVGTASTFLRRAQAAQQPR